MMGRKLIGFSVLVCVASLAGAIPSRGWASNGWTTESSSRAGWEKTEVKFHDTWKQPVDDSQGKGWVSSENPNESKTKSIPTSWQKVERHHGESVKGSGWTNVGQKTSQDIANGFVVHHPVPSSSKWNQSPYSLESWKKQNSAEEVWASGKNADLSPPAGWEKAAAEEQWQQTLNPPPSSAWEKSPDASSTGLWNKESSPSVWENDAKNDKESAAGYAATGPAQYHQEPNTNAWQAARSADGWQKDTSSADAWKKDSPPSALYDAPPSKWNTKSASENSEWQKSAPATAGWDASSDLKSWQKETNGWISSAQNHPQVSAWQQLPNDASTQKPWQEEAVSNGWQQSTSAISNGWDKQGLGLSKRVK